MGLERPPIFFYAFDLLRLNGKNVQNLPIEKRKAKLEELLKQPPDASRSSKALVASGSSKRTSKEAELVDGIGLNSMRHLKACARETLLSSGSWTGFLDP